MKTLKTSRVTWFGLASVVVWLVTVSPGTAHAQWTTLTNAPPNYLNTCLQLTDGSAMCHRYNTNQWWRLIPDNLGSYADGTWSATAPMPDGTDTSGSCAPCVYAPLYYAFMHGWTAVFGASDKALRLPSAVFGAAAPIMIALAPGTGLSRTAQ